ncbi:hypothetical protein D3C87_1675920 [compost metagenome]
MTIDLSAMISPTMSRISSRADCCSIVASWLRSMESIRALKMADLVWKYSLSRCTSTGLRTSSTSSVVRWRDAMPSLSELRRGAGCAGAGSGRAGLGIGRATSPTPGVLPPNVVRLPNMLASFVFLRFP